MNVFANTQETLESQRQDDLLEVYRADVSSYYQDQKNRGLGNGEGGYVYGDTPAYGPMGSDAFAQSVLSILQLVLHFLVSTCSTSNSLVLMRRH